MCEGPCWVGVFGAPSTHSRQGHTRGATTPPMLVGTFAPKCCYAAWGWGGVRVRVGSEGEGWGLLLGKGLFEGGS